MKKINVLVTAAGSACSINIVKSLKMAKKYKIFSADIYYNSVGALRSYKGFIINKENNPIWMRYTLKDIFNSINSMKDDINVDAEVKADVIKYHFRYNYWWYKEYEGTKYEELPFISELLLKYYQHMKDLFI